METKDTVQALMDAIQMGEFGKAKSLLSEDFKFSGPVPKPMSGEEWIGISASLQAAFPDLNYHFKIESANGDSAHISAELNGTHSGELNLTAMHMGVIPATGKSFKATRQHGQARVKGNKVVSFELEPTEGAGLMAILSQIGIKVPSMQ